MKRPYIIGVDPGFSGAIAVVDASAFPRKLVAVHDMPTLKSKKGSGKRDIDVYELGNLIGQYAGKTAVAIVERVGAMPEEGVVSVFRFGLAAGSIHGALGSYNVPMFFVEPAAWKCAMGLSQDKSLSRDVARRHFGDQRHFERAKDDGRAEAALLALFGARTLVKDPNK